MGLARFITLVKQALAKPLESVHKRRGTGLAMLAVLRGDPLDECQAGQQAGNGKHKSASHDCVLEAADDRPEHRLTVSAMRVARV
ncbi:MAG: hypothetical protein A2W31_02455 [Planctomycetes bacterium RBG_16_64_10]|nr:MAG: hypothetical protein A2W31_02455 [Planctomycetes bacterium RBG_16_64_10]